MPRFSRLSTGSILALTIASGPAWADLRAEEVWTGIQSLMQDFGYTVSATETPTGNGLEVSGITMAIAMPEENGSVTVTIDDLSFAENDDGSVSVTFPEVMPIAITAAPEGEDDVSMQIDYANSGLELVVSGDVDTMLYAYSADSLSLSLAELVINGAPIGRDAARFDVVMQDVNGTASTTEGGSKQITQDLAMAGVSYDLVFNDPDSDDTALVTGSVATAQLNSSATLPEGFDPSDPASLTSGFATDGTLSFTNGQMEFAVTDPSGTTSGTTQTGAVSLGFAMDDAALRYEFAATDQALSMSGSEMMVPISVSMARTGFTVEAPIAVSETPEDIALGVTLGGFEMSELLWNMLDPGAALPRDPATVALRMTGKVTPFVNLLDPVAMAQLEATGGVPGELNALTLEDLTVEVAGAKLGGSGAFTFDNSDLQTFGGVPRPNGEVTLSLDGANGLIDKLIAMGVLTAQDAMGARMMMGMFAVPGDGPDSLTSSIRINEQGHVLANGMRIQ